MFHASIEPSFANPAPAERFFAADAKPLHFSAALARLRTQAQPQSPASGPAGSEGLRFATAVRESTSRLAFRPAFTADDWRTFAGFCIVRRLGPDTRVVIPGRADGALRFVVEGSLSQQAAGHQPELLVPGAILGEDTLFSDEPCASDVRALEHSIVLELSLQRRKELTASCRPLAFELLRAAGAVIAARCRMAAECDELATN